MRAVLIIAATIALAPGAVIAGKLDDHPAVVAHRQHATQGYDYASKFYPHPAWLYLRPEAPRPMADHPAVIVFKRQQQAASARGATAPQVAADFKR